MPIPQTRPESETKCAENLLFSHYLRTGVMLAGEAAEQFLEQKFNPYHDPDDGRFTFKPGGGSLAPRQRDPKPANESSASRSRSASANTRRATPGSAGGSLNMQAAAFGILPLPDFLNPKPKPTPAPPPSPWARTHPGEKLPVWRRRDPAKETAPVANWRAGGNFRRLEIEQRAENAYHQFYYNWGRGMTREEAAAWAANSEVESRSDHTANQDGGAPGKGLFQWEKPGRADIFEARYGFPLRNATRAQQHTYREWELQNEFRRAKRLIDAAVGAGEKARVISLEYLRPASKERTARDRANIAEAIIRRIAQ